jgi:hypothetical protein
MSAAMLEHIEERGSLKGFPAPRREKLTLVKAAIEQGLIVWNKTTDKYELTTFGYRRLEEHRHKIATGA